MNAPTKQSDLVKALTARYIADPRLANEVVTGACAWGDDIDLEDLLYTANDLVAEANDTTSPVQCSSIQRDMRIAAAEAIGVLFEDEKDRRRADEDAWENGRSYNINGGQFG